MARKFFNQKVKKSKNISMGTIVVGAIVGILILIAVGVSISVASGSNKQPKNAVIKLNESISVEVNSKLPDKTTFFTELEHVPESDIKVSYDAVDLTKVGEYNVTLTIYKKVYQTTLKVIDTESPELVLKDYSIPVGSSYKASDFVESCSDNSKDECNVSFYSLGLSQDGSKIDYSSFKNEGSYSVQIIATDASGNASRPKIANLIIGKSTTNPTTCNYGGSEYDTSKYILAVNVTDNGCALDLNLYHDEKIQAPVIAVADAEQKKLEKEFSKINLGVKDIYVDRNIGPVLNTSGTGVVGYTLFIEVSIINSNGEKEVIESYHVNLNGGREYVINKYLN